MKRLYIIKNSIAYYILQITQVLLLISAMLTACCGYYGTNEIQYNIIIKLIMLISILLIIKIDKIKIK